MTTRFASSEWREEVRRGLSQPGVAALRGGFSKQWWDDDRCDPMLSTRRTRGIGGPLLSISAYAMKHPLVQFPDSEAKVMVEEFIQGSERVRASLFSFETCASFKISTTFRRSCPASS